MAEFHETLIKSLVTRPGSAPTLAIIELFTDSFLVLSGLFRCLLRVSSLHFDIVIDLKVKDMSSNVLTCAFYSEHLKTYPLKKNVNCKEKKLKRNHNKRTTIS